MQLLVNRVHAKYQPLCDGQVATYIPELTKANPDDFGVCLVTSDGRVFEAGDCDRPFTIQSISKPFTFGMAIDELGQERCCSASASSRAATPSTRSSCSRAATARSTRWSTPARSRSPRCCTRGTARRALAHLLDRFSTIAGRQLEIDQAVYESERRTGHRNRAIAHLLLNFGVVHEEAEAALDLYFQQCSILVTCRDLAMMGATLSNMGCHPLTGKPALSIAAVKDVLSVMFTCGMYDYSGQWALSRRRAGQERRRRRRGGGGQPPARHRHLLAAAG